MTEGSVNDAGSEAPAGRPSTLARAARELTELVRTLQFDDLSAEERQVLRALLAELARLRQPPSVST